MKGLILKDLYNVTYSGKSLLFSLAIIAFCLIPSTGGSSFVFCCVLLFNTMTVSTFSFDNMAHWPRYALIMPISRRTLVAGKYMVMLILSVMGAIFGFLVGLAGDMVIGDMGITASGVAELALVTLAALLFNLVIGGTTIPLVFHFGPERGRMLIFAAALVPTGLVLGGACLLRILGVAFTEKLLLGILCAAPVLVTIWNWLMYQISCRIFIWQEIQ